MKIAVIDIETTGFKAKKDYIVEIGIAELDLDTGKIEPLYNNIVREEGMDVDRYKDSWIFHNSSLTFENYKSGALDLRPTGSERIQQILDEYPVTAYNSSFDFSFLKARGFHINKELPCPMKILTDIIKLPYYSPSGLITETRYKYPSVEEAYKYIFPGIDYKEDHRALPDAYDEACIIYEMHKKGWYLV